MKFHISRVITALLLTLSLVGCSENPTGVVDKPVSKPKISIEVTPDEVAKVAAWEKKLQERYQATGEGNFTSWKDLDQMLRSYARSQYSRQPQSTMHAGERSSDLLAAGSHCGMVVYERLPYEVGASFMRKFASKHSSGGESLLPNLVGSETSIPVFIQAQVEVGNKSIPMLVTLNSSRDNRVAPIILDLVQAGFAKDTPNMKLGLVRKDPPGDGGGDDDGGPPPEKGPKCSWCTELRGEEAGPGCSCQISSVCMVGCSGTRGACTSCPDGCKPRVDDGDNIPILFSPTNVPFEPFNGGGFTDPLPPGTHLFSLPKL